MRSDRHEIILAFGAPLVVAAAALAFGRSHASAAAREFASIDDRLPVSAPQWHRASGLVTPPPATASGNAAIDVTSAAGPAMVSADASPSATSEPAPGTVFGDEIEVDGSLGERSGGDWYGGEDDDYEYRATWPAARRRYGSRWYGPW